MFNASYNWIYWFPDLFKKWHLMNNTVNFLTRKSNPWVGFPIFLAGQTLFSRSACRGFQTAWRCELAQRFGSSLAWCAPRERHSVERCPPAILKRLLSQMYVLFALNAQKASGYEKKKFCSLVIHFFLVSIEVKFIT